METSIRDHLGAHSSRFRLARLGILTIITGVAISACADSRTAGGTAVQQPPPEASSAPLTPPVAVSPAYRAAVVARVASAIHQTVDHMKAELNDDPNATLMRVAKPLGLAQDQLTEILLAALKDSGDSLVIAGTWTTPQAVQEQQFWAAQPEGDLVAEISRWVRGRG